MAPTAPHQVLLGFTRLQKIIASDEAGQLSDKRHVLADVPAQLSKFRVLLDEPLHVRNCLYDSGRGCLGLVRVDIGLECFAKVAKVGEELLLVERVGLRREGDFLG